LLPVAERTSQVVLVRALGRPATLAMSGTAPQKKAPADFLRGATGRPVVVRLTSGAAFKGVLVCVDAFSNVALEQTEEFDADGALRSKYGDCFIRGNNGEARERTPARPRAPPAAAAAAAARESAAARGWPAAAAARARGRPRTRPRGARALPTLALTRPARLPPRPQSCTSPRPSRGARR